MKPNGKVKPSETTGVVFIKPTNLTRGGFMKILSTVKPPVEGETHV